MPIPPIDAHGSENVAHPKEGGAKTQSNLQSEAYAEMQHQSQRKGVDRFRNENLDPFYHDFTKNVLDPRGDIPPDWFQLPLSQKLLSQVAHKKPEREDSSEFDSRGNINYGIDLHRDDQRLKASVGESKPVDYASLHLLLFDLRFANEREFDKEVKKIAHELHLQKDLDKVRELAEKVVDPTTRRGLMMATLEKGLHRYGDNYLNLAYEDVQKIDTRPETLESAAKRTDGLLQRLHKSTGPGEGNISVPKPRPGLSPVEEQQLASLCGELWTKDELLWNMARAKYNWSGGK